MWTMPEPKGLGRTTAMEAEKLNVVSEGCNTRIVSICYIPPAWSVFDCYLVVLKDSIAWIQCSWYDVKSCEIPMFVCLSPSVAREGSEAWN